MTTDEPQSTSDHAAKDVQTTATEKAPVKDIETQPESSIVGGKSIDSAEPASEETAESKGEDTKEELEGDEEEDYEEDEDDDGEGDEEEDEESGPEFDWGGRPRGRINPPIKGNTGGSVRR